FRVDRGARGQAGLPILDEFPAVVGMNRVGPSPALCLFRSHAYVIEPALIEEVAIAIRTSSPCCSGNRVDDGGKIALARLQSFLPTVVLGDVDDRAHELHKLA